MRCHTTIAEVGRQVGQWGKKAPHPTPHTPQGVVGHHPVIRVAYRTATPPCLRLRLARWCAVPLHHAWLHGHRWSAWHDDRKAEAVAALAPMGIRKRSIHP